ncbi:protein kinase [Frankia sp. Mgl5]|uniref:NHL domain-containing protein n=1 Tax=Frankia sp. Mgl5 TaxID=2933793 RepID=UPI002010B1B9|nr:protein kinase [Frankia sp. Mgl5]MCK9929381.1 protein kinase [Frankia sp. Mgl5]
MPIVDRELIAAALPGHALGRDLGSGAFGLVLAARRSDSQRDVAVKVVDLGTAGLSPDSRAAASGTHPLTEFDHPHLARTHAVVAVDRLLLFVTELLPGGSLERQNLDAPASCAVALAVADGLTHAHAASVLHLDITPANILFTADGRPKLTDLGVAGLTEDSDLTVGRIVGTPQYLAPEQVTGDPLGPPTDLYALAAVLYELLAGTPLFGAGRTAPDLFRHHCEVVPPPPPGVPEPVADLLARALAKRPAERHQTAAEFARHLAEAARRGYGPGWLAAAGVPLDVPAALRELAAQPPDELGGEALAGEVLAGGPPAAVDGAEDPSGTVQRPTGVPVAPVPGRSSPPEPAGAAVTRPESTGDTTDADGTRPLSPRPVSTPPATAAAGDTSPDAPDPAALSTALVGPETTAAETPADPSRRHRVRLGRLRLGRTAASITVVFAVLALAAAVVLRVLDDGADRTPVAQPTRRPAGPTAPPTVLPTAESPRPTATTAPLPVVPVAGTGQAGFSGDGGPAAQATLNHPYGPAVDAAGAIYVPDFDNHRVRRIGPDGTITTVAGTGQAGFSGDGGPATAAMLNSPAAVAVGPDGTLYIVDTFNVRVRRVGTDGIITTIAGSGERPWNPDDDGGPATSAALWYPSGIAVDPAGGILIADNANDLIRRVDTAGIITTVVGRFGFGWWGDGGPAAEAMASKPFSVACDREGRIYIADSYNHRIRRIDLDGVIETIAGTGVPGFSGDGGKATAATLRNPRGVAVDAAGNVYVTDASNNRIRRIDPAGIITTIAGTAPPGRLAAGAPVPDVLPDGPVAVDDAGHLYVAARGQNRIVRIDLPR